MTITQETIDSYREAALFSSGGIEVLVPTLTELLDSYERQLSTEQEKGVSKTQQMLNDAATEFGEGLRELMEPTTPQAELMSLEEIGNIQKDCKLLFPGYADNPKKLAALCHAAIAAHTYKAGRDYKEELLDRAIARYEARGAEIARLKEELKEVEDSEGKMIECVQNAKAEIARLR